MADSPSKAKEPKSNNRFDQIKAKIQSVLINAKQRRILWLAGAILIWLVLLVAIHSIQQQFFNIGVIWGDDFNIYNSMLKHGFWYVVGASSRPISLVFILLGFQLFGINTSLLGWYWAAFFAFALVCVYVLFSYVTRNLWLPFVFLLAALFSRLNWYYYIVAWGVMESLALAFTCLSLLFLVRWHRDRKWPSFVICLVFALLTLLCHERFLALPVVIAIIGVILGQGWKQKTVFGVSGVLISVAFYILKTVVLGMSFWVVTGKVDISLDIGTLVHNFWRLFVNCFYLDESQHWYTGLSTSMVQGAGSVAMAFSVAFAILCFVFVIYDLVLGLYEKRWHHVTVYLFIAFFYLAVAAGGSVSPDRIEPRWVYPAQMMVFLLWAFALRSFRLPEGARLKLSPAGKIAAVQGSRIGVSAFTLLALSLSSFYVMNNRYRYYIDDWYSEGQTYYDSIIKPYRESGKEALFLLTTAECEAEAKQILKLYPPKTTYLVVNGVGEKPAKEKWNDCHICIWNPQSPQAELYSDLTFSMKGEWMEESLSFYILSESEYISFSLTDIDNPTGKTNGITVKVNDEVKYHEPVNGKGQFAIPLKSGVVSYVEIIPDFTWCPKDYGMGEDARNLSLFIDHLGHTDIDDIHWSQDWTDPVWAASVLSEEPAGLSIEMPSFKPEAVTRYGVSLYVNKSLVFHENLAENSLFYIVPLRPNVASLIEIVPDETFNPKKAGTGDDERDLGVFINAIKKAETEIKSFENEWTTPNYSVAFFNTKYSQISVSIYGDAYPYDYPNEASFWVNEECALQAEIPPGISEYLIDIPLNSPVSFTIISKYSFVPKEMGMGDDIRHLGLYILDFHPVEVAQNS